MTKIVSRGDPIEPVYINNLQVGIHGWGVVSGLTVAQRGAGANMSVDVASGEAWINATKVEKGSTTNVVITTAHATYDRYDLVVINSSGTISVIAGTAAATSYANDYDLEANNAILIAEIYIPAADTTIETSQCTDKRIISFIEETDVANGIAGLDASTEIPVALLKTNVANGIAGLDASADIPLAQIPNTLTGKDADTLDTKHYSDISSEIDADITTHAALGDSHHTETHTLVSHDTTVTGAELNSDHSKLSGIETGADVTDATNVNAAGAAMNSDKNVANGIAGLDASADIADSVIPGLLNKYALSEDLLHSNNTEVTTTSTSYVLKKTIEIDRLCLSGSSIRIKFATSPLPGSGTTVYGRIYKNGSPVGTERINTTNGYVTYSEDLAFEEGDDIELYLKSSSGASTVFCKNFRIYGTTAALTLKEAVEASDFGETTPFTATNT